MKYARPCDTSLWVFIDLAIYTYAYYALVPKVQNI